MERAAYDIKDLETELDRFEQRFGMRSVDFYYRYLHGKGLAKVPPFETIVWADTCRGWIRSSRAAS